jgi:hypothetical protein
MDGISVEEQMVIHRSQEGVLIVGQDKTPLPALDSSSKRGAQTRMTRRNRPCERIEPDDCRTASRVLNDQDVGLSFHEYEGGSRITFSSFSAPLWSSWISSLPPYAWLP